MSVTSRPGGTGTMGGDILSQALLQTGLSTPIKEETSDPSTYFLSDTDLRSYDMETLAGCDLMANLGDINSPSRHNLPHSAAVDPGSLLNIGGQSHESLTVGGNSLFSQPVGELNIPASTDTRTFNGNTAGSVLVKVEEPSGDLELEDLLANTDSYNPTPQSNNSTPHSNYPTSYPPHPGPQQQQQQYNTYQPPLIQASPELPELSDLTELDNILGDDSDFLNTLTTDDKFISNSDFSYAHNQNTLGNILGSRVQAEVLRPASFSGPPFNYPIGHHTNSSLSPVASSLMINSRQQQQQVVKREWPKPNSLQKFPLVKSFKHVTMGGSAVKRSSPSPLAGTSQQDATGGDSDEEEDEDYTSADTYANYTPAKVKIGISHPDSVVESSSLSSVDPPDVYFDLKLPQEVISSGKLSSLQLESVIYACQQHMNILADGTRAGFLVGDGAGVGKGRTIAGIIYQNYLEGRKKAIWLSVSNDLRLDALRDLKDVGAKKIEVYSLNKFHYGKISGKRNGRVRKGIIFATYSSLIGESSNGGKYRTRFNQLLHWLGSRFEGVIVFDECHKAKNLVPTGSSKPSKTGMTVLQLQKKLPKARIVYCSATGASEPKNMAYMSRLGIWGNGTQFNSFQDFIKAVERRGVGAMEIVAIDMKLRGMYMARQLSFSGVNFSIKEVQLIDKFVEAYDASVKLWAETRRLFQDAAELVDYDKKKLKTMWGQFWASHQRFFKYMCIAAKVPEVIQLTTKALEAGKCVVIGLQSTGEARTLEQLERNDGELNGFISTAKGVLETLIRRHFPTPAPEPGLSGIDWSLIDNDPTLPQSCRRKRRSNGPRKARGMPFQEDSFLPSDSEDSSGSPERSDSAVESSSDEEEDRSSEGSGSSSSESEDDEDSDTNPFGGDISEPWLQKKKVKAKSRKRPRSPSCVSSKEKRKKNFSIKPPPQSSRKGKIKTGFNSKKLKFEQVQSPDTQSNKPSPFMSPSVSNHCNSQSPVLTGAHTFSVAEGINRNFASAQTLSGGSALKGTSPLCNSLGDQNLIDAMSSKFNGTTGLGLEPEILVKKMKEDLLNKVEILGPYLPTNTLDELIDGLGGTRYVAEMTGRRGRVVSLPGGGVQYQLRSEQDVTTEMLNIREKHRFMDGEKNVAIISEAASSGISLQADRRVKNRKRRVHITLELPWSADRAIQQFGRTHRSNQVTAPEYVFLISTLSGEQRFASIVAKRLESLGALTHGDRRATESRDLSKYNLDTKYGRQALENTVKSIVGMEEPLIKMDDYPEDFFENCQTHMISVGLFIRKLPGQVSLDKDATTMSRFLNRILGLPVKLQNQLFSYFSDTLAAVIQQAKRTGRWDGGILDYGGSGEHVEIIDTENYVGDPAFNTATTQLYTVQVGRGMSFEEALEKLNADSYPGEGFYVAKKTCSDKLRAILIKSVDSSGKQFSVYRPNIGRGRIEKLSQFLKKHEKVSIEEGKKWWTAEYESSLNTCTHAFSKGKCRHGASCEHGLRRKTYYMLGGSILGVWSHIEGVFSRFCSNHHSQRMQIIRVKADSKRLVGILVPKSCIEDMRKTLTRIAQQAEGTEDNPITL